MLKKLTVFFGALAFVAVMAAVGDQADARKNKTEGGVYLCHFDKNNIDVGKVQWESGVATQQELSGSAGMHLTKHNDRVLRDGVTEIPDDYVCKEDLEDLESGLPCDDEGTDEQVLDIDFCLR